MSLENLQNQSFSLKTKDDWKAKAEESLKGKSIESLKSSTYEEVVLKPLYSRQDHKQAPDYPGGSDFRRGIHALGYVTNDWKVAQRITYNSATELKEKLHRSIEKGQTAISFDISEVLFESKEIINEVFGDLPTRCPLAINGRGKHSSLLVALTELQPGAGQVSGYVGSDPFSLFAEEGFIEESYLRGWMDDIKFANEKLPNLRTVLINTSTYHSGGANAVQELGIAAATGNFYLQKLVDSGLTLKNVLGKMIFQFSIGSNFFMELAKVRAARILWNRITQVYGADKKDRGMHIAAETSSFTKTLFDPHVNILRAGNEAFAAVLGGVQYLHVTPYDFESGGSQLSERIARNTQNILKEEAYLQKVVDPAGGSWYVEALTTELAEKAWQYFQQIESKGGMLEVLKTGWLQDQVAYVMTKREQDANTRKQSIVGTNVYANLAEVAGSTEVQTCKNLVGVNLTNTINIRKIENVRLSESFEKLRKKSRVIESKFGTKPEIGMICLGELKYFKPRLDFMRGFAAAGGIEAVESGSIMSLESAKEFVLRQDTKYFCLCGSNEQYEAYGHEILSTLSKVFPTHTFYLAGMPEKEMQTKWVNEGIKQFIHIKSDCYEILSTILTEMEVALGERTKS